MATDDETLYIRAPRELAERVDTWIDDMNQAMQGGLGLKLDRAKGLRALIERGLQAFRDDVEGAAKTLDTVVEAAQQIEARKVARAQKRADRAARRRR